MILITRIVAYGCETLTLSVTKANSLFVPEKKVFRRMKNEK
jgi:hypothetical protein